jgi:hypothetical protein
MPGDRAAWRGKSGRRHVRIGRDGDLALWAGSFQDLGSSTASAWPRLRGWRDWRARVEVHDISVETVERIGPSDRRTDNNLWTRCQMGNKGRAFALISVDPGEAIPERFQAVRRRRQYAAIILRYWWTISRWRFNRGQ